MTPSMGAILISFLSTLSLRRATQPRKTEVPGAIISIHALLAESDGIGLVFMWWGVRFLSTLSLRRATAQTARNTSIAGHFYPRSPCGERRVEIDGVSYDVWISIHALLAESDDYYVIRFWRAYISIHALLAESDSKRYPVILGRAISIHALLAESDCVISVQIGRNIHFYPRSPCGERPPIDVLAVSALLFLSTLSLRRATQAIYPIQHLPKSISIHALLAESDYCSCTVHNHRSRFLSTLSLRRATRGQRPSWGGYLFLSTLSLRRATETLIILPKQLDNFYPRSPCGERR